MIYQGHDHQEERCLMVCGRDGEEVDPHDGYKRHGWVL